MLVRFSSYFKIHAEFLPAELRADLLTDDNVPIQLSLDTIVSAFLNIFVCIVVDVSGACAMRFQGLQASRKSNMRLPV